jgi:predicted RNA methylase
MSKIDYPFLFVNAQKIKKTFNFEDIPTMEKLDKLEKNDEVIISNGKEHFKLQVEKIDQDNLQGTVKNYLLDNAKYDYGDKISFRKTNILKMIKPAKKDFKELLANITDDEIFGISKIPNLKFMFPFNKNSDKLLFNKEAVYSTSSFSLMKKIIENIEFDLKKPLKNLVITDATANIGGSAVGFAMYAKHVNAIEISPNTFKLLENNVSLYNLKNIKLYNQDYLKIWGDLTQDVIFVDPPWGGLDYKKADKLSLYLSGIPLWKIVNDIKSAAKLIVLKVPLNFNREEFEENTKLKITYREINRILFLYCTCTF